MKSTGKLAHVELDAEPHRYSFHLLTSPSRTRCVQHDYKDAKELAAIRLSAYSYAKTRGYTFVTRTDDGNVLRVYRVA